MEKALFVRAEWDEEAAVWVAKRVVPIPVHGTADIGKGLLADIERQTGVKLK